LGVFCSHLNEKVLKNFLKNLSLFEENLKEYNQNKNAIFEKKLLRVLDKIELER